MRGRRFGLIATTLVVVASATAVIWPRPVAAAVGYQPVPHDSWGTDGSNAAAALVGSTLYVGGSFGAATDGGPRRRRRA